MESERAEACKYKEITEEKFRDQDLKGSYRYAHKAYELFPKLEGISAMKTAVEVHLAAEAKLHSEFVDWYAILQVNEFSHLALIKKRYRKLSLVLRRHKNKSPVAEGAFKLIREAWAVLSDKLKKCKYDRMRRSLIIQQQQVSEPASSDPNTSSSSAQNSSEGTQMGSLKAQNVNFSNGLLSSADAPMDFLKKSYNAQSFMDTHVTFRKTPNVDSSNGEDSATPANMASGKAKPVNSTFWTACSTCNAVQECPWSLKKHELQCPDCMSPFLAVEVGTMSINDYSKRTKKGSNEEKVSAMIENEMNSHEDNNPQHIRKKRALDQPKKAKSGTKRVKNESKKQKKSVSSPSKEDPSVKIVDPVLMAVQDSDFYDFDQDRVENCFEENQIWAMYDDHDGMPRYYARIDKVVSLHPFKVQMTWLEGKDNGDEFLTRWANAGFCRTCGDFMMGRETNTEFLNVFSHLMKGEKAVAGLLKIFPRKGSVWALYKNWQSDWDESTPKEVTGKYDIVGVMTDFTERMGGSVVPLVKLDGFKSVYHRIQMGSQAVRWVLRTEFLRFSHQIPARRLLGNEAQNLPKGCWELDPAASPID